MLFAYLEGVKTAAGLFGTPWSQVGEGIKRTVIGHPGLFLQQARRGELFTKGTGLLHKSFFPESDLTKALQWGLPALTIAAANISPSEPRGRAIGNIAGATLGGFLGAPLGVIGGTATSSLFGDLGASIGSHFDKDKNQSAALPSADPSL